MDVILFFKIEGQLQRILKKMNKKDPTKVQQQLHSKTDTLYNLQQFRSTEPLSVRYFDFPIHFKKVEEDYIIYRGQNWHNYNILKTIIFMPATAYLSLNTVYLDCVLPGLLASLPSNFQIIVAKFPNAPQHKFPTPVLHLQKTISKLIQQGKYLVDVQNVVLSGYSCGGTMAIPLAIYFASQSYYFKSLMCVSPVFDYSGILLKDQALTHQWEALQKQDFPFYAPPFLDFVNSHFSRTTNDLLHPWYSPIFTPVQQLTKLKNTCFVYGEKDFMRRSIEAFRQKLTKQRINSESIIFKGEGHNLLFMAKIAGTICEPYTQDLIPSIKMQVIKKIANHLKKVLI